MIIETDRLIEGDLEVWRRYERGDRMNYLASRRLIEARVARSVRVIREFATGGPGYIGVSWGKDSVVTLDLCRRAGIAWPAVHVKVLQVCNPDTDLVRDAWLERFPDTNYHEIFADRLHKGGSSAVEDPTEDGFDLCSDRFGDRYISGVRADEAGYRTIRMRRWGESTERTCAPIGWWEHDDVFAYLAHHDLPVHPAYAYTRAGMLERSGLRAAAIGGKRGRQNGRLDWERLYYPEIIERLERALGSQFV